MGEETNHSERAAHILRGMGIEVESEEDFIVTTERVMPELDLLEAALYLLGERERDDNLFRVEMIDGSGSEVLVLRADRVEDRYIYFQEEVETPNSVWIEAYSNQDFSEETLSELTMDPYLWHIDITRSRIFQVNFQKVEIKSCELFMRMVMVQLEGGYFISICDNGLFEFGDDEDYDYDDDYEDEDDNRQWV